MSLFVSSIIGGVNEQNIILKNVRLDDWTPELAIIASIPKLQIPFQNYHCFHFIIL